MSYEETPLNTIVFDRGFKTGSSRLSPALDGYTAEGSSNAKWLGEGYYEPFRGVATQGAGTGSRVMKPVGETWGGIKDIGVTVAAGTVSEEINRSLWGIGAGQVHRQGTDVTGFTLSTFLKVALRSAGVYGTPFTAGLAQPSAPLVGVMETTGSPDGAVSFKLERHRPSTGGLSVASLTSEVIVPQGKKVRVTFPAASSGQTHWRLFVTLMRFGGQGIHYALPYNGAVDITEADVAAGTVDGISRSLEFDWKDGDLVPIEASYDDYSPQAATHHLRIESVMCLAGSYADASSSPSSTNTGSAIQVSKENNYESYNPTHLLFLPERVVDTLSRPIDSFAFVGCENSIHAIQYIGSREDLPSCTVTTILQDQGIQYSHNWCHFRGRLAVITAEGNWLLMSEDGSIDSEWTAPIRSFIRTWTQADTAIGYDPKNDCLVIFNGRVALHWSLQNQQWSNPVYLQDYGITAGSVQSCQTAKRRLYITIKDGSNFTAYEWDSGAVDPVPVSFVSHYSGAPSFAAAKNIYQLSAAVETAHPNAPVVICLSRNLQKLAFRDVTRVSFDITDNENSLTLAMDGKRCAIFGPDIGGASIDYILGYLDVQTTGTAILRNAAGAAVGTGGNVDEALMFVGDYIEVLTPDALGADHLPDVFPNVPEARSLATGVWFQTSDHLGSMLAINLFGSVTSSARLS